MTGATTTAYSVRNPAVRITTYNNADVTLAIILKHPPGCPTQLQSEMIENEEYLSVDTEWNSLETNTDLGFE